MLRHQVFLRWSLQEFTENKQGSPPLYMAFKIAVVTDALDFQKLLKAFLKSPLRRIFVYE